MDQIKEGTMRHMYWKNGSRDVLPRAGRPVSSFVSFQLPVQRSVTLRTQGYGNNRDRPCPLHSFSSANGPV